MFIGSVFFPYLKKSETLIVSEKHIFNLSIFGCNPILTDIRGSGNNNHHLKITHFSLNNNIVHFLTKWRTLDNPVRVLHVNL